jgi:DNA-binding CsgD family transcriptional regulator
MRILLVGSPSERARLRAELNGAGINVVGEFGSLADARAAGLDADGILVGSGGATAARLLRGRDRDTELVEPLTAREVQVLELLAEGLPNKAIAERLGISDQTVKFHVASIFGKLGARNRTDAVRLAARRGLITL